MSENQITAKIRELRQLEALIAEAQAEADTIKDEIKTEMGDREELRAGEYRITWKTVETARLDAVALRKEMPEVAATFTRTTKTRRFCVA